MVYSEGVLPIPLLESTIKATKVDIQKHWHWTDVAGLAELKKVVFEELVASHTRPPILLWDCFVAQSIVEGLLAMTDLWMPAFAGMTIGEKGSDPINAQYTRWVRPLFLRDRT
jgi:hypothetical protein